MDQLYQKGEKLDKMDVHEFRAFAQKHFVNPDADDFEDDDGTSEDDEENETAAA